jgi:aspartyl-tRNA(Asn)/glutamyl-tRNA(Gln) amidotransferase subunit A
MRTGDFSALVADLKSGRISASARTDIALQRIAAENDRSRIFISVDADGARAAARASDNRRAAGQGLGPLDGIPVAIKDNIDVAGLPTTDGTGFYRDRIRSVDAFVVARLRAAGAVITGKLNMHEGALGATTDNPFWGRCENPLAEGYTPGGSSGGSGAVVAAGIAPLALGSDTMGSVRIPAAYCGVWGLKPTRGLFSSRGLSHLSWTLDTIGPIATGPDGLRAAMTVMAEVDPADLLTADIPSEWHRSPASVVAVESCTIGVPDYAALADCEPAVLKGFSAFLDRLGPAGVTLQPIDIAGWDPGKARRAGLLLSEAEGGALIGADLDRGGDGFSDGFRTLIDYGRSVRGERLASAYREIEALRLATQAALRHVDAILLPTAPQRAFAHGTPAPVNQADFTAIANIAGCPAVAFPLPAGDGGMPISAQVVGPRWSEHRLLAIAEYLFALGSA